MRVEPRSSLQPFRWQELKEKIIIGVDEVGRGCLAGPVYAGAVRLEPGHYQDYVDSKSISANRREQIAAHILDHHPVGIGIATVEEIDELNIFQASLLAMRRAVAALSVKGGHLLVDGAHQIPAMEGYRQTALIKGDQRAEPIGAASIVAKVARDQYMTALSETFWQYGFEKHKGYPTETHKQAIQQWGPTIHHRKSFSGVREFFEK